MRASSYVTLGKSAEAKAAVSDALVHFPDLTIEGFTGTGTTPTKSESGLSGRCGRRGSLHARNPRLWRKTHNWCACPNACRNELSEMIVCGVMALSRLIGQPQARRQAGFAGPGRGGYRDGRPLHSTTGSAAPAWQGARRRGSAHNRRHDSAAVQGEENEQVLRGGRLGPSLLMRLKSIRSSSPAGTKGSPTAG